MMFVNSDFTFYFFFWYFARFSQKFKENYYQARVRIGQRNGVMRFYLPFFHFGPLITFRPVKTRAKHKNIPSCKLFDFSFGDISRIACVLLRNMSLDVVMF